MKIHRADKIESKYHESVIKIAVDNFRSEKKHCTIGEFETECKRIKKARIKCAIRKSRT